MEKKLMDPGMRRDDIRFRPHHFLCAFNFKGAGYSKKFVRNFSAIMEKLNASDGDQQLITVAPHTDDICAPCPHKRGIACESEEKVRQLDAAHSTAFGLEKHAVLSWSEFKQKMQSTLTIDIFDKICANCEWKVSGICESVLRRSGIK